MIENTLPTEVSAAPKDKRRGISKVMAGAVASASLVGVGAVVASPPAAAHCPGAYTMNISTTVGGNPYWRGATFNTGGCHSPSFDVQLSWVQLTTNYTAFYQDSGGNWHGADLNDLNNGRGPWLEGGNQNPWKAMITNLPYGRGVRIASFFAPSSATVHS